NTDTLVSTRTRNRRPHLGSVHFYFSPFAPPTKKTPQPAATHTFVVPCRHRVPQVHFPGGVPCKVRPCACSATKRKPIAPARSTARYARDSRTCTFARTDCITARIAAKLATLPWPTTVPTEPKVIALKVERDARLVAGAGGVARYLADSAGMPGEGPAQLQAATVEACLQAFGSVAADQALRVSYAVYADRIEIEFVCTDQPDHEC